MIEQSQGTKELDEQWKAGNVPEYIDIRRRVLFWFSRLKAPQSIWPCGAFLLTWKSWLTVWIDRRPISSRATLMLWTRSRGQGVPRTLNESLGDELSEAHHTVASYEGVGGGHSPRHHGHNGKESEVDKAAERSFRTVHC